MNFVSCIVGKREFTERLKKCSTEREIATVSDEALTHLGFENAFPVWSDVWTKSKGKICHVPRDEEVPEEFLSDKHTVYTTRRDKDGSVRNTVSKVWSHSGILRFNRLRQKIREDRARHRSFLPRLLEEWRSSNPNSECDIDEENVPEAEDDFGDTTPGNSPVKKAKGQLGVEDDDQESYFDEDESLLEGQKVQV